MAPKRVLVVLTSFDTIVPMNNKPTGWYLSELAHPYEVLADKVEMVTASPKGGVAPLDPASIEASKDDASSMDFYNTKKHLWEKTEKLENFVGRANEFDAIFYPGGHGPMFDLATNKASQQIIAEFYAQGKPIAFVCHGSCALVHIVDSEGKSIIAGREVTGFSNSEEDEYGFTPYMPFMLEDALQEKSGGKFVKADKNWGVKVCVADNIITGQNPASAKSLGETLRKALGL